MVKSTNHGFTKQTSGVSTTTEYVLSQLIDSIDTEIEIRDTDSNKSEYEPKDGAIFRATDIGAVYIGDGTSWNLVNAKFENLLATEADFDEVSGLLTDDFGYEHNGRVADAHFGFAMDNFLSTTTGSNGSVSFLNDSIEFRNSGAASAAEEQRAYNSSVGYDPSETGFVGLYTENITIDDSSSAEIILSLSDSPDSDGTGQSDEIALQILGNGTINLLTSNDGTANTTEVASVTNTEIEDIDYIEIALNEDSGSVYVEQSNNTYSEVESTNYPTGETLNLKVASYDSDGSAATNVDFDVTQFTEE